MDKKIIVYLLFIAFMFIGSFGGIIFYYTASVNVLVEQTAEYFEAIAQARAHDIEDFLKSEIDKVELIATHQELSNEELQEIVEVEEHFYEVFVMDAEGKIIASSDISKINLDRHDDDYFIGGRTGTHIKDAYFSEDTKRNAIAVSMPYHDNVLVARIEIALISEITTDRTGLGETGEIYLINKEGYVITPLRFLDEDETFLKKKIETENSEECLEDYEEGIIEEEEEEDDVRIFENYKGVKVIGTDAHIPEMQWCLLAEINEREAIELLKEELIKSGLLILIGLSILVGIFVIVVNRFLLK